MKTLAGAVSLCCLHGAACQVGGLSPAALRTFSGGARTGGAAGAVQQRAGV